MTQCGYVALVGKPNAGKSTLLNALVGHKLAVVSRKPQTTRNRILGIVPYGEAQLLFLDTPGLHRQFHTLLNRAMNTVAQQSAAEAQVILYLIDIKRKFDEDDQKELYRVLAQSKGQLLLILSQSDSMDKERRLAEVEIQSAAIRSWLETVPEQDRKDRFVNLKPLVMSAKRPEEVKDLTAHLANLMPESPWLYPEDDLTDRPQNFLVAELIREQLFRQLGQEIPYGTAVKVVKIEFKPHIVVCQAEIFVSRVSHKAMVLGQKGQKIKEIGTAAKEALEAHFEQKVYLELNVKVEKDWMQEMDQVMDLTHLVELQPEGL